MLVQKDDNKKEQAEVVLFGETYIFKGNSAADIKKAAEYVNDELEIIKAQFPHLGRNRIIVLALMKVADSLLRARRENEELIEFFSREE